jgi:hypothetical protein
VAVEITPSTVQLGDVITIGGYACEIVDLRTRPDGAKILLFRTGEILTLRVCSRFGAVRTSAEW